MPRKKIHKVKTRAYFDKLLEDADVTDEAWVLSLKEGLTSDNPSERAKSVELIGDIKGISKFDKKTAEEIESLPLANVKLEDLDRLANRCSYCKHKKFEPLRAGKPIEPVTEPVSDKVEPVLGTSVIAIAEDAIEKINEENPDV